MVSTYTTALDLEKPARGDQVGTWDTPVNGNMDVIDAAFGQTATISGAAGSVVLAAAQFRADQITFNSTLLASITITFPTSFTKPYMVQNQCTGSSAFTITLTTTAAGGQAIVCPPWEIFDCVNDGTNLKFRNFGRVGTYWDYAGSSVPSWVSGCTVPPYLNCDGTTFASSIYPALALILGSTTLPDSKGRFRATLNQGTARITSGTSTGGVDGNTAYASGGSQTTTLSSQNMPPIPITDPGHTHTLNNGTLVYRQTGALSLQGGGSAAVNTNTLTIASAATGISAGSTSPTNFSALPPVYIGGITLIRAA
jgi:hypothetical protein